jgi:hypothetical protein
LSPMTEIMNFKKNCSYLLCFLLCLNNSEFVERRKSKSFI